MGSRTFNYAGAWQQFAVPNKVEYVTVTLNGAGSNSRRGGRVSGRIKVNDRQTLWIMVGGAGKKPSGDTGGGVAYGGGGAGGKGRGRSGGWGGGGATSIRVNSATGTIRAVAGGAGGTSGDGGVGGRGGAQIGEYGAPGSAGPGSVGNATGGTQVQGGNKGTSSAGEAYDGAGATDVALARGGAGGGPGYSNTYGGGGGGGGYRAGGGGQAGLLAVAPGGGGGGGSNYTGGLIGPASSQGGGATGNGSVTISWTNPPPANQPPSAPTSAYIAGKPATDEHVTRSTGSVNISAVVDDPAAGQTIRLIARYSTRKDFGSGVRSVTSDAVKQTAKGKGRRASVTLKGLSQNTRYYVRLYAKDSRGLWSTNYRSINFWTNRFPTSPELVYPADNTMMSELSSVVFQWTHIDPDPNSSQRAYQIRWRQAQTPTRPAGEWTTKGFTTWFNQYVADPGTFAPNMFHEWQVRTQDPQSAWGPWSETRSFFITGQSSAPALLGPIRDEAVNVSLPIRMSWRFRDPDQGDAQAKADIRYRPVGGTEWFTVIGSESEPGGSEFWDFPENTFAPATRYEWQARTQDTLTSAISEWSESAFFWTVRAPGIAVQEVGLPQFSVPQQALGCGENRVFVYDRGGRIIRGEITPIVSLTWNRKRDDISNCIVDTNGFGQDCGDLLRTIHCWTHELVVFRDGIRVWEGPITRITDTPDGVELEAKDVMGYVYRRIMRQGYNDTYRKVNGVELGDTTVVERATRIIMNALAPDDPNILPYLTSYNFPDDAPQSRIVPDFSRTAWEEVDDLAATAGLDYVTVGRRIILNDTHRPLGRLPEMRDDNFSSPPVVSEYGMLLATAFGVTNNNGVYGLATRPITGYGLIEQLASAYGESEGGAETVLTPAARAELEKTLTSQAERNIAGRYPTPLVVRVPDNSTLHPETPLGMQQLVPGVWIPLRARGTVREVSQWQKLDLVTVTQTNSGEQVMVTMSPAPNAGEDPDADAASVEE